MAADPRLAGITPIPSSGGCGVVSLCSHVISRESICLALCVKGDSSGLKLIPMEAVVV